jgi:hypothetical protein
LNSTWREYSRVRNRAFRLLALLLGLLGVGFGLMFLVLQQEDGWYRKFVVPIAMIGTGLCFLAYAISGRARMARSKEPANASRS